jgi:hypothetical protein
LYSLLSDKACLNIATVMRVTACNSYPLEEEKKMDAMPATPAGRAQPSPLIRHYVEVFSPLSSREATAPGRNREKYSIGFVIFVLSILRDGRFMCGLF